MAHASNEELRTFDGPSLVATLVEQRISPRYQASGLAELNPAERVLLSVFEMDNEVCNGGFGQWLFHVAGDLLRITPICLREIASEYVAALVEHVLKQFGEQGPATDYSEREEQLFAMPESASRALHDADLAFNGLEQGLLQRLYEFARTHLADFRSD